MPYFSVLSAMMCYVWLLTAAPLMHHANVLPGMMRYVWLLTAAPLMHHATVLPGMMCYVWLLNTRCGHAGASKKEIKTWGEAER